VERVLRGGSSPLGRIENGLLSGPFLIPDPAYEHYRAHGHDKQGRRLGHPPKPFEPPETLAGKINTTDLDSRNVKTPRSYTQGYNAQAVVNEEQIVLAAEVTASSPDFGHLEPGVFRGRRVAQGR
jgi:hypothetical protein